MSSVVSSEQKTQGTSVSVASDRGLSLASLGKMSKAGLFDNLLSLLKPEQTESVDDQNALYGIDDAEENAYGFDEGFDDSANSEDSSDAVGNLMDQMTSAGLTLNPVYASSTLKVKSGGADTNKNTSLQKTNDQQANEAASRDANAVDDSSSQISETEDQDSEDDSDQTDTSAIATSNLVVLPYEFLGMAAQTDAQPVASTDILATAVVVIPNNQTPVVPAGTTGQDAQQKTEIPATDAALSQASDAQAAAALQNISMNNADAANQVAANQIAANQADIQTSATAAVSVAASVAASQAQTTATASAQASADSAQASAVAQNLAASAAVAAPVVKNEAAATQQVSSELVSSGAMKQTMQGAASDTPQTYKVSVTQEVVGEGETQTVDTKAETKGQVLAAAQDAAGKQAKEAGDAAKGQTAKVSSEATTGQVSTKEEETASTGAFVEKTVPSVQSESLAQPSGQTSAQLQTKTGSTTTTNIKDQQTLAAATAPSVTETATDAVQTSIPATDSSLTEISTGLAAVDKTISDTLASTKSQTPITSVQMNVANDLTQAKALAASEKDTGASMVLQAKTDIDDIVSKKTSATGFDIKTSPDLTGHKGLVHNDTKVSPQNTADQTHSSSSFTSSMASSAKESSASSARASVSVAQQVSLYIRTHAKTGDENLTLQLHPSELGRVEVKLSISSDKTVQATVTADNSSTLDLMKQDQKQLYQALEDAGLKADSNSLQFSLRDQGQGGNGSANEGMSADQKANIITSEIGTDNALVDTSAVETQAQLISSTAVNITV